MQELPRELIDRLLGTPYGEAAYRVVERLEDAGYDTWWVGGGTRDLALGKIPNDIDIGTAATPERIGSVFKDAKQDPLSLGSMRVKMGRFVFEVTTFREDDEASDGRHPESVVFSTREKDAVRRDFTINAIYYHPVSREVYDPTGGLQDVGEKLIRFIGAPAGIRIKHDALRILRAVRMRALVAGQYHPETYAALRELAPLTEQLSGARQLEELEKMLAGPDPARALEDLWELGVLPYVAPELHACKGIAQPADYHREGDVWDHLLACTKAFRPEDDRDVRLAALFHDVGKAETFALKERIRFDQHASVSADIATATLKRWQAPKKRVEKIDWIIRHHMTMGTFLDLSDERKAHWYFHPWFQDLLRVFWLDIAGTTPSDFSLYDAIVQDYHAFVDAHPRPPKPLLTGARVMQLLGIGPGERVGEALKALHDAQMRKEVITKREAEEFVLRLGSRQ